MYIIGIAGKIGAGKSTVAKIVKEMFCKQNLHEREFLLYAKDEVNEPLNIAIKSFGGALKEEVSEIYDFPIHQAYSQEGKNRLITRHSKLSPELWPWPTEQVRIREILQWYGTDFVRNTVSEDYWIVEVSRRAKAEQVDILIIDDVRFANELAFVNANGTSVKLEPADGWQETNDHTHSSETCVDENTDYSIIIHNEKGHPKRAAYAIFLEANASMLADKILKEL